ncbi:MAG: SDR family oxidoreductase [Flavobacteriaceae bacterium]|nr:SDR family oxidoreductase [Flavobacteriaceae bacterium]
MSKVVLITGGSSGIGKSIGNYLTEKGCIVYGTSRNPDRLTEKFSFQLIQLDVTQPDSIKGAISKIIEKESRIDVVINNAGIGITGPIEETPEIEIKNAFDTNFYGPLNVIKEVLPFMRIQKSGLVLNITSIAGYMGLPYRGLYSASKAALEITTEAYRMEVKQFGIEMATIAPGDFATNIAAGRYHSPELNDSPYKNSYGKTLQMMNEHVSHGEDPIEMAKKVYQIINTTKPKVAYKVGSLIQKCSIVLKRVLPSKVYEKMLMNHYKL